MELRNEIIQNIIFRIKDDVPEEALDIVTDALTLELGEYEVERRCTEVATRDTTAMDMLRLYIVSKNIEGLSTGSLKRYWNIDSELLEFIGKPITEITAYDIRFFLSYRRQKDGITNRTLDNMRLCYNSFFSWMVAEGHIERNPCAALKQIKYKKDIKMPFSAVEVERIRSACKSARDLALVDFLYSTGCRVSEVSNLCLSDVNFERLECKVVGKGNKERIVYLSPVAMMHLNEYLKSRCDGLDALFVGRNGRLSKSGIEAALKRLERVSGVSDVHPHRFRRTLATNLLDRGMSIQDVAQILGHADLKTTQIYCYISQENVESAYKKYAG